MAINKVIQNNNTLIDLTNDTVALSDVMSGSLHLPNGEIASGVVRTATSVPISHSTTISFAVDKEPVVFYCIITSANWTQSTTSFIYSCGYIGYSDLNSYLFRGSKSSSSVTVSRDINDSAITWTYNNGTLTITAVGSAKFAANTTYTLIYI